MIRQILDRLWTAWSNVNSDIPDFEDFDAYCYECDEYVDPVNGDHCSECDAFVTYVRGSPYPSEGSDDV